MLFLHVRGLYYRSLSVHKRAEERLSGALKVHDYKEAQELSKKYAQGEQGARDLPK
jgi:hypothetical protein